MGSSWIPANWGGTAVAPAGGKNSTDTAPGRTRTVRPLLQSLQSKRDYVFPHQFLQPKRPHPRLDPPKHSRLQASLPAELDGMGDICFASGRVIRPVRTDNRLIRSAESITESPNDREQHDSATTSQHVGDPVVKIRVTPDWDLEQLLQNRIDREHKDDERETP